MTIVELNDITLDRGSTRILSGISWRIERGQHWALLGANGSGKTTLLKIVTGYEWPTDGSVSVLGEHYGQCNLPELRKRIGWVSTALEQRLPGRDTALEVVISGLAASIGLYRDFDDDEWSRARIALARMGGEPFADRPFGLLSQGEQQRVLIARGLVNDPAMMILDEPCAGLDPAAREAFLSDLGRLAGDADAPTLILVTHHIEEIGSWVNHVLVLEAGFVLASGDTPDVLTGEVLGRAFGRPCEVERDGERFRLRLDPEAE